MFSKGEQAIEPAFLPIPAASKFLGLSPASIYRLIGLGKLQAVKAGGKTLLVMQSLRDYAASLPPAKIKPPHNRMGVAQAAKPMRQRTKHLATKPHRKRAEAEASNNEASA